jgi:septum formation protein
LAEIPFQVIIKGTDESYPDHLSIEEIPVHIAKEKALAVKNHLLTAYHSQFQEQTILAADTVVVLGDTIIGKPANREAAIATLQSLSGREHSVITGVFILGNDDKEIAFSDTTKVCFHPLTDEQITYYVDTFQPFDKAGAYAIQEWIGAVGIQSINGDFYNVMGLPISKVVKALEVIVKENKTVSKTIK